MTLKTTSGLALISGGLDSILAALLVKEQGIKVTGLTFKSLFFDPEVEAKKILRQIKIPLKIIDFSEKHLKIVKNPYYGYGKNANPCLDCHLLMLKTAKKLMLSQGYRFIITGEVLAQRPFSQNQASLNLLEKQSGLKGLILRPLSAKLLKITIPEQKGLVNRHKLLDLCGRSRREQLKLAKKYNLKSFSAPGTSCILTDPYFTKRLLRLLKVNPKAQASDVGLLKLGRLFWHPQGSDPQKGQTLMVIGRNHQENLKLIKIVQKGDIILEPQSFPGPTILIRSYGKKPSNQFINEAKKLFLKYASKAPKKLCKKDIKVSRY